MAVTPEQAKALALASARRRQAEAGAAATPPKSNPVKAATLGFLGGITGNFADEMAGGSVIAEDRDLPLSQQKYHSVAEAQAAAGEAENKAREDIAAARAEYPKTSTVGELAGAALPVGQGAKTLSVLSNLPRWARLAAGGAAAGAVYGAGEGEGAAGKFESGAAGAAVGAPLGVAIPSVLTPAINFGRKLSSIAGRKLMETPRKEAERRVAEALQADLADPDAAARLGAIGKGQTPMVIADVGENTAGVARGMSAKPGPFRTEAAATLRDRQTGQQERLLGNAPPNVRQVFKDSFDKWIDSRITLAGPKYDEAYAASFGASSPQFKALLGKPAMRDALAEAERQIGNESGIKGGNVQRLDLAKRVLDDRIESARLAGKKNESRMLANIKNELVAEMDRQVPAYAEARNLFAGEAGMRDSANMGADLFKSSSSPDEARQAVAAMSDGERQAFQRGGMRGLIELLEKTPESRNAAQKLIDSVAVRDKLRLLFPDSQDFDRFVQSAADESQMSYTKNKVLSGSPTARIHEEVKSLESGGQLLNDVVNGDKMNLFGKILRFMGAGDVSPEVQKELADLLLRQQSPKTIQQLSTRANRPPLGPISNKFRLGMAVGSGAAGGDVVARP